MEPMCVLQSISCTASTSTAKHMTLLLQQTSHGFAMVEMKIVTLTPSLLEPLGTNHFVVCFSSYIPMFFSMWWYSIMMSSFPKQISSVPNRYPPPQIWDMRRSDFACYRMSHLRSPGAKRLTLVESQVHFPVSLKSRSYFTLLDRVRMYA